jgi:hypothetical protein
MQAKKNRKSILENARAKREMQRTARAETEAAQARGEVGGGWA